VPLAAGDPVRAVALGSALAVMVGVICLAAALARLGFLTDLLSRPVRVGYMNGIALTVLVSQLPKMLGFRVEAPDFLGAVIGLVQGVVDGKTVPWALAIGAVALAIILGSHVSGGSPACYRGRPAGWRSRPRPPEQSTVVRPPAASRSGPPVFSMTFSPG
jgi:MFS superfamily sulfate permease-like transporter